MSTCDRYTYYVSQSYELLTMKTILYIFFLIKSKINKFVFTCVIGHLNVAHINLHLLIYMSILDFDPRYTAGIVFLPNLYIDDFLYS